MNIFSYVCIHQSNCMALDTLIDRPLPTLADERLERAAYVLKAVAHPVRLAIIGLLARNIELSVSTLQGYLGVEQSLLSHHLSNLRDKGVLLLRKDGKNCYYSLSDPTITNLLHCINDCPCLA